MNARALQAKDLRSMFMIIYQYSFNWNIYFYNEEKSMLNSTGIMNTLYAGSGKSKTVHDNVEYKQ